jgi:acyl-CoA reductase-like NAD-dependent aldehyde dehydrogenase
MIRVVSPIDGRVVAERPFAGFAEAGTALMRASDARESWKRTPLDERIAICQRFADIMDSRADALGLEITLQMGRPIRYAPREIMTMGFRARTMGDLASRALADIEIPGDTARRFIRREPLGTVMAITPWNYPYLTAGNSVVPALLAGNTVILKPSPQTPLCGERIVEGFADAGLPTDVLQCLHLAPETADQLIRSPGIDFVAFTGSVAVGRRVEEAAAGRFIGVGLELGGKDGAYVRADADLDFAVEDVLDGAFFNSGQSCCAIERIYVHASAFDPFIERAVEVARAYVVGDPREPETTLGPMVSASAANAVRAQIREAVASGAREVVGLLHCPPGGAYVSPQIFVNVDSAMGLMQRETFGPVVGVMPVASDEEAVQRLNDSGYGLTASIWTTDFGSAQSIGERLEVGTVFVNRCDYLDPMLAWTGVKDSGRGVTLSELGFAAFTRPKSFYIRSQC